ncbi:hypothetical protein ABGB12_27175 [Actinocorallia sp. B10E7]|uniref:hypothetical protein n=1 Tax=Actinocorallia sp. B10E7 TaxID=3153558 RepID=UPI00325D026A
MLPQADEVSPWSSPPSGGEPWPPEPWQPEPVRQGWRAGSPQDDRPWEVQDEDRPWAEQPQERPWGEQRPWAEQPGERPWGEQPGGRPWDERQQRPWAEQPGEARPWDAEPGQQQQQQWGGGQQQPWNAAPEQRSPHRGDGEQWLPDEAPRWRGPLIAGLVAALLTATLVVGYVFWTKDDDSDKSFSQPSTSQNSESKTEKDSPDSEAPDAAGDPQAEAEAVDTVLSDMSASRKKLANITYTCANKSKDISAFETVIEEREGQLSDVNGLSFGSLENGEEVKNALIDALQASIDSNQEALTWLKDEDGCDKDAAARLKEVTDKATDTKRTFLDLWNPIATERGLQTWTRENI